MGAAGLGGAGVLEVRRGTSLPGLPRIEGLPGCEPCSLKLGLVSPGHRQASSASVGEKSRLIQPLLKAPCPRGEGRLGSYRKHKAFLLPAWRGAAGTADLQLAGSGSHSAVQTGEGSLERQRLSALPAGPCGGSSIVVLHHLSITILGTGLHHTRLGLYSS